MRRVLIFVLLSLLALSSLYGRWGWNGHRFINNVAVDHLPEPMSFFKDHRDYLSQHSTDPDTDSDPGYYHYIDIDYYPEFFAGTLPSGWDEMIALYGLDIMEDNGLIPWVIEWWISDLTSLMENGNWDQVWQVAAELGHYVADSHQALHLTLNYNGQLTGNHGIHSRYETHMINPHLGKISFRDSLASYWDNPLDSIFAYIEDIYPLVGYIMEADNRAVTRDPNYGDAYYEHLWEDMGEATIWSLNRAVIDLASIWYTVWTNAGEPYPPVVGVGPERVSVPESYMINAFPNPFNPTTTLSYDLPAPDEVTLTVFDSSGRLVRHFDEGSQSSGHYDLHWDGRDASGKNISAGIYLCKLSAGTFSRTVKIVHLK